MWTSQGRSHEHFPKEHVQFVSVIKRRQFLAAFLVYGTG